MAHAFKSQDAALTMGMVLNVFIGLALFLVGFLFELLPFVVS